MTKARAQVIFVLAEAIRELGEVPSGHLYAGAMNHLTLENYQAVIDALKRAKLVEERNHLLTWIGSKEVQS